MPDLEALAHEMKGRNFALVALSSDDSWEPIKKVLSEEVLIPNTDKTLNMRVYRDPSASTDKQQLSYGTEKLPETYVIDKQGKLRLRLINVQPWKSPEIRGYLEWLSDQ